MLEQEVEKLNPQGYLINVEDKYIRGKIVVGEKARTEATKLRFLLKGLLNRINRASKKSENLQVWTSRSHSLLKKYVNDIDQLIKIIESAITTAQIQHLKIIQKIESILDVINGTKADYLRIQDKYPFSTTSPGKRKKIRDIKKELDGLSESIGAIFGDQLRESKRLERSEAKVAKERHVFTPLRLYLVSKNWDELRNTRRERVYMLNEEDMLTRINEIRNRFLEESSGLGKVLSDLGQLANLMYAFVYDVKNLLDFYKRHLASLLNLQIDLQLEDAEKLRELEGIIQLLEKITQDKWTGQFQESRDFIGYRSKLAEFRDKILVYAQYNYQRDVDISKEARSKYLKSRREFERDIEYDGGYKGKLFSYKITLPGARTGMAFLGGKAYRAGGGEVTAKIRGEIFMKDPKNMPKRAIIIATSFTTYRQIYTNMAAFLAEDNYLVLLYDPPSHGESRGVYGNGEGSENIFTMARFLRSKFGVQRVAVFGYSMGANQALFSLMYYNLEIDSMIKQIQANGHELSEYHDSIRNAILKSYQRNAGLIDTFLFMNSFLINFPGQGHPLTYKLTKTRLGGKAIKYFLGSKKNLEDLPEDYRNVTRHNKAWERYLEMIRKKDPKKYGELKKIDPLFVKGISAFDRDKFVKELIFAVSPMDYLGMMEKVCPELLGQIFRAPKLFMWSEDDETTKFRQNKSLYLNYPKKFGNSLVHLVSGYHHNMKYPHQSISADFQARSIFLNYLHQYLKYHL